MRVSVQILLVLVGGLVGAVDAQTNNGGGGTGAGSLTLPTPKPLPPELRIQLADQREVEALRKRVDELEARLYPHFTVAKNTEAIIHGPCCAPPKVIDNGNGSASVVLGKNEGCTAGPATSAGAAGGTIKIAGMGGVGGVSNIAGGFGGRACWEGGCPGAGDAHPGDWVCDENGDCIKVDKLTSVWWFDAYGKGLTNVEIDDGHGHRHPVREKHAK